MKTEQIKIEKCIRILGSLELADDEVRGIRDDLYYLAESLFDLRDSQEEKS